MLKPNALRKLAWNDHEGRVRALWRLIIHAVAMVVGWYLLAVLAVSVGLAGGEGGLGLDNMLIATFAVLGATYLTATQLDRRRFAELGLALDRRWWLDAGVGVVIGVALMSAIFAIELGAGWVAIRAYATGVGAGQSFALGLSAALLMFVCVAFYEELVSRGYHLRNMAEGLAGIGAGPAGRYLVAGLAIIGSSAVFGLLHASNANATALSTFNVGLAGVMLAASVIWTGQLGLAMGLHLSWNFCQGNLYGFPVSGSDAGAQLIALDQLGDPLVTGGAFGPEAGLLGVAAMIAGIGLQAAWVRVSRGKLELAPALVDGYSAGASS